MEKIVAGLVGFHSQKSITARPGKPEPVRILVVGGGTGIFSRELLPEVEKVLAGRDRGIFIPGQITHAPPEIEVIETDVSGHVAKARGSRARAKVGAVLAEGGHLPFKDGHFDIVITEAALNFAHPDGLGRWLDEIGRVLRPDGTLLNNQHSIPNSWAPKLLRELEWLAEQQGAPRQQVSAMTDTNDEIALNKFREQLTDEARARGFKVIRAPASATVLARRDKNSPLNGVPGNSHEFKPGLHSYDEDPNVPRGMDRITYRTHLTIATRAKPRAVLEFMQRRGYVR